MKATRLEEWRRGWPVVVSAALGYGTGGAMILLTAGLFIVPMRAALGWSTRAVAISPIVSLVMALAAPLGGIAIDRIGSRRAAIAGSITLAACAVALGVAPVTPTILYSLAVLTGLCATLTIVPTYTRAVATWFREGPGLAFGVALSGSAFVAIVALPSVNAAIQAYGWRAGYLAVAAIILLVGLPAILLGYREKAGVVAAAAAADPIEGSTLREALRSSRFWIYIAMLSIACFGTAGFVAHLQPILIGKGFATSQAVTIGVAFALAMSFGKIIGGLLLDRLWPFAVAAGLLTLAAIGAVGLASIDGPVGMSLAVFMAVLIGLGQGAEADFVAFFCLRGFGLRAYSAILGSFALAVTVSLSAVAFLFGWIVDTYGSYRPACYLSAACLLSASALFVAVGLAERRAGRRPVARPNSGR